MASNAFQHFALPSLLMLSLASYGTTQQTACRAPTTTTMVSYTTVTEMPSTTSAALPSNTVISDIDGQFFLQVQPLALSKRDLDPQFVDVYGGINISDANAAMYELNAGTLVVDDANVTAAYLETSIPFSGLDNGTDVIAGFSVLNNVLSWSDVSFANGQALFALDDNNVVQAIFNGSIFSTWTAVQLVYMPIPLNDTLYIPGTDPTTVNDEAGFLNGTSGGTVISKSFNVSFDASLTKGSPDFIPSGKDIVVEKLSTTPQLLPNLNGQYGGVDITQALGRGYKTGLFDFTKGGPVTTVDIQQSSPGSQVQSRKTFNVPGFMYADNAARLEVNSIYGESRSSYQRELSKSFGLSAGAFGFSTEVSTSFSEKTTSETYMKYAAQYTTAELYHVSLSDNNAQDLRQVLSANATDYFKRSSAADIVNRYGTHYMTSATFGGSKRYTSKLDIRDSSITTEHSTALALKASLKDPALGNPELKVTTKTADATTRKIGSQMGQVQTTCLGGNFGCETNDPATNTMAWYNSIYQNPVIINQKLATLDNLIIDSIDGIGKKAAVAAAVANIMNGQRPTPALAMVIFAPMEHASDDAGGGAKRDFASCNVRSQPGWYTLGQYGQGSDTGKPNHDFNWNQKYMGIMIKETENVVPGSILQVPRSQYRTWGMKSKKRLGTYEVNTIPGFASLGSIFKRDDSASLGDFGSLALVNTSLLIKADYRRMWVDQGTGASQNGAIWAITGPADYVTSNGPDAVMQKSPSNNAQLSYLFHSNNNYNNKPSIPAYQLDFSKIIVVSNNFLSSVPVPATFS